MKRLATTLAIPLSVILITFSSYGWSKDNELNMTKGVTAISEQVYELHMLIFYICCAIALVVFGVMFYAIIRHRKSKGAVAAHFHESTK
ncbi:cytochrome c oxidase subunit II transmembrane domain-containing protein, partial [Vibrio sp. 1637]